MANFLASPSVSQQHYDMRPAAGHSANMSKRSTIGWYLQEWREFRGLTQDQLAEMSGYSKPYISQLENGVRQFTEELLSVFSKALNVEPIDLIALDPKALKGEVEPSATIEQIYKSLNALDRRRYIEFGKTLKSTAGNAA
jgi:transcriptional regulator with XRE-family HTH domain